MVWAFGLGHMLYASSSYYCYYEAAEAAKEE